jgi:hypothetical protein
MRKAGGIIALIAGIFGIFAAGLTLLVGGVGSAVKADNAQMVVGLGWGGVAFSFVIILGAVAMGSNSRIPGMLLVIASIAGAILGGTLVAIFMLLAFAGGVLAVIPGGRAAAPSSERWKLSFGAWSS